MNTNWVWLPKIALNVFLCFFCEPILIFWNVIKFLLVYYEVLHSLSVTPVIQAQMLPTFDLQNMLQNYVTAPKPKNALDICDKAWRQCFLFHYVHFVIFLWALYQMPNRSLASDFDTLNPNSKFPALPNEKWVAQRKTSHQNTANGFCFEWFGIRLSWKHLSKFSALGYSMHEIIEMTALPIFSNLSRLINLHIWMALSWTSSQLAYLKATFKFFFHHLRLLWQD